jgi:hypothetical protein
VKRACGYASRDTVTSVLRLLPKASAPFRMDRGAGNCGRYSGIKAFANVRVPIRSAIACESCATAGKTVFDEEADRIARQFSTIRIAKYGPIRLMHGSLDREL